MDANIWLFFRDLFIAGILVYGVLLFVVYMLFAIVSSRGVNPYIKKEKYIRYNNLIASNQAPGISIVVYAYNDENIIVASIRSMLALEYPNYEIVVVNDGSTDCTLNKLIEEYNLESIDFAYEEKIKTYLATHFYKSTNKAYQKIIVVDKLKGENRGDALNVGINISSFDYFFSTDGDCILPKATLEKMIYPFLTDEDKIIPIGKACSECGYIPIKEEYRRTIACGAAFRFVTKNDSKKNGLGSMPLTNKLFSLFLELEYIRSYILGKMGGNAINCLLNISGNVGLFNKEIALTVGGYNPLCFNETTDLITKMAAYMQEIKQKYSIRYIPSVLCQKKISFNLQKFNAQKEKRGKGIIQNVSLHRRMLFNPKYGRLGMVLLVYNFLFKFLTPLVEIAGVIYYGYLFLSQKIDVLVAILIPITIYGCFVMITHLALYWDQKVPHNYSNWRDFAKLSLISFFEPIIYHPVNVFLSFKGYLIFVFRKREI